MVAGDEIITNKGLLNKSVLYVMPYHIIFYHIMEIFMIAGELVDHDIHLLIRD